MSADAALVTGERKNVLLVPSAAITADRAAGTYTVNVVNTAVNGSQAVTKTAVTVGLKDGENTEITSGLSEGEKVLVGEITTASATGSGLLPGTSTASSGNGALGR
jgi:multidrug efflux pump subunit AcrA (membrane-fusion protein)